MASIKTATDETFDDVVGQAGRPVILDFWAAWCHPCKSLEPELEKIAEKYDGVVDVVKIDIDANPGVSQMFQVMTMPTIIFIRPDQTFSSIVGQVVPAQVLEARFELSQYAKNPAV